MLGRVLCCHPRRRKVATAETVRRGGNFRELTEPVIPLRGIYHGACGFLLVPKSKAPRRQHRDTSAFLREALPILASDYASG